MEESLHKLYDCWVAHADTPVIIDGDKYLTGRQVAAVIQTTMKMLKERGIKELDMVAMTGASNLYTYPIYHAVKMCNACFVGLALFESAASRKEQLKGTRSKLLLVDAASRQTADEIVDDEWHPEIIEIESFLEPGAEADPNELYALIDDLNPNGFSTIRYTSGSTGKPRGILGCNSGADVFVNSMSSMLGEVDGRFLCTVPLTSMIGIGFAELFMCLGQEICIYRGRPGPAGMLAELERDEIGYIFLPSSQVVAMVREPAFEATDLSKLKTILYAGQAIAPNDLLEVIDALGGERLLQFYGQTEAGIIAALSPANHATRDPEILASAGTLFVPQDIEIRGPGGEVLPEGEAGEIFLRGNNVSQALWEDGQPKSLLTDGWLATKDCGRVVDGKLWITGRVRDMVLYRGYNVPSRSVEEALASEDDVIEAVVHPVKDAETGEAVFAWVQPAPGAVLDFDELRNRVEKLEGKWARPKYIEIIDQIPRLVNLNKVDKLTLMGRAEKLLAERS